MKSVILLISSVCAISLYSNAQIQYSYDASGNRIRSYIKVEIDNGSIQKLFESIEDTTLYDAISIYPNPSINKFIVKSELDYNLTLFDLQGRVMERRSAINEIEISVSNYKPGIYIIVIERNGKKATWKLVKSQE